MLTDTEVQLNAPESRERKQTTKITINIIDCIFHLQDEDPEQ